MAGRVRLGARRTWCCISGPLWRSRRRGRRRRSASGIPGRCCSVAARKRRSSMTASTRVDPERGLVSPADFVPAAEKCGLIVPIGNWVLQTACREAMRWPGSIPVAVNVSTVQLGPHQDRPIVHRHARDRYQGFADRPRAAPSRDRPGHSGYGRGCRDGPAARNSAEGELSRGPEVSVYPTCACPRRVPVAAADNAGDACGMTWCRVECGGAVRVGLGGIVEASVP